MDAGRAIPACVITAGYCDACGRRKACEAETREPLLLGVSRELLRKRLSAAIWRCGRCDESTRRRCLPRFFPTLHPPHAAQQLLCEARQCLRDPLTSLDLPSARHERLWAAELWHGCSAPFTCEADIFRLGGWVGGGCMVAYCSEGASAVSTSFAAMVSTRGRERGLENVCRR